MDWINLLTSYGWPTAALACVLWMLWRAVAWLGPNAVLPVVRRVIGFVDELAADLKSMRTELAAGTDRQAQIADSLHRLADRLDDGRPCTLPFPGANAAHTKEPA